MNMATKFRVQGMGGLAPGIVQEGSDGSVKTRFGCGVAGLGL